MYVKATSKCNTIRCFKSILNANSIHKFDGLVMLLFIRSQLPSIFYVIVN